MFVGDLEERIILMMIIRYFFNEVFVLRYPSKTFIVTLDTDEFCDMLLTFDQENPINKVD